MKHIRLFLEIVFVLLMMMVMAFLMGTLAGCALQPPDVPVCVEFAPDHGKCVKIISGKEFVVDETHPMLDINDKPLINPDTGQPFTWWEFRPIMVLVPSNSWAEIKAYTIKACKKYGNCQKEVTSWDRTLENIDSAIKAKENFIPGTDAD